MYYFAGDLSARPLVTPPPLNRLHFQGRAARITADSSDAKVAKLRSHPATNFLLWELNSHSYWQVRHSVYAALLDSN